MSVHDRVDGLDVEPAQQHRVLLQMLVLNVLLSSSLAAAGIYADSSGLIANALDNASDSAVYAISYAAVGRSRRRKTVAASNIGRHAVGPLPSLLWVMPCAGSLSGASL